MLIPLEALVTKPAVVNAFCRAREIEGDDRVHVGGCSQG